MKPAQTLKLFIPLIAVALLLSGCGFKLRGAVDLPENIRTVQVMAPPELRNDILTLLESGGVGVSASGSGADARITVTSERFSRRVLSVDPTTGKEREFELAYTLDFGVTDRGGQALIENGKVNLLRDYVFDPEAVISRKHAYVYRQNKNYTLYVVSNAGTQVNSDLLDIGDRRKLSDGDVIVLAGKMAIDATIKGRLNPSDFTRVWPKDWGDTDIEDYLD